MPAKIYHYDLYGKRNHKYNFLKNNSVSSVEWTELNPDPKYHFFVPKDFSLQAEWEEGVKVSELFMVFNSGVKTDRDSLFIDQDKNQLAKRFQTLLSGEFDREFRDTYRVVDSGSFKITERIKNKTFSSEFIRKIQYRPFDYQWIYYDPEIISRPASSAMKNAKEGNLIFNTSRSIPSNQYWNRSFITGEITDVHTIGDQNYSFPLYLYPENGGGNNDLFGNKNSPREGWTAEQDGVLSSQTEHKNTSPTPSVLLKEENNKPRPNFNPEIIKQIEQKLGMTLDWQAEIGESNVETVTDGQFIKDAQTLENGDQGIASTQFTPTDLLDYIYAVLHSPSYREKYKEFLKIDFPRVPFDAKNSPREGWTAEQDGVLPNGDTVVASTSFWNLVKIGKKLRKLHLMEGINPLELEQGELSGEGENVVEKIKFEKNNSLVETTTVSSEVRRISQNINTTKNSPREGWTAEQDGVLPSQAELKNTSPTSSVLLKEENIGKVWINDNKYFDNVPEVAWNFYIGGYQPAQKWLKDRKGRELTFDDILHYQKIIHILAETHSITTTKF